MFKQDLYNQVRTEVEAAGAHLIVVSKDQQPEDIRAAYQLGQYTFGESYVQALLDKKDSFPEDIEWHFVGHLQRNKVRPLMPFIGLIHSVDSYRLLKEIDKWAKEEGRVVDVLLQMHISDEHTKHGFGYDDLPLMLRTDNFKRIEQVRVRGLMGIAAHTDDTTMIRTQYRKLKEYFDEIKMLHFATDDSFSELSMGMSHDYQIALEEGATIVRIGSLLFE